MLIRFLFISLCLLSISSGFAQLELEEDFSIQLVTADVGKPNGLIFDDKGDMLVWEKIGLLWRFKNGEKITDPVIDIREEVMSNGDLGLLSVALDGKGYIYFYYIVDYHHLIHFGSETYRPYKTVKNMATIGRVTRYQMDGDQVVLDSRQVLIGKTKENGIPVLHNSHVGGSLVFADDGSLFLSIGDCSTWEGNYVGDGPPFYNAKVLQALEDEIIRPEEEVGTMRAQMINSYSGKIIRFDPETGLGYPSNPFYKEDNPDAPQSKVWALGFRNPYRMTLRKGSGSENPGDGLPGTLLVGEVGGAYWEELNVVTKKGQNFGWPIFEGNDPGEMYELYQTNKDVINPCNDEPFRFQDLIQQRSNTEVVFTNPCDTTLTIDGPPTFIHQTPSLNFAHITAGLGVFTNVIDDEGELKNIRIEDSRSSIQGDVGTVRSNAVLAGSIYTGDKFPDDYKNDLFITDFSNGWISRVELDLNEEVEGIYKFYKDTFKIKHLTENKSDGCLYVIKANDRIEKICYDVNVPPIVDVQLTEYYGPSPLEVTFDASGTIDPENGEMHYKWQFGDGVNVENEDGAKVSHTYISTEIETFTGTVEVQDEEGAVSTREFSVFINNSPPQVEILGLSNNDYYSTVGKNIFNLMPAIEDSESPDSDLKLEWIIYLHHNAHYHEEEVLSSREVEVVVPPVGCTDEIFYYRIAFEATDPQGLIGRDEVFIYPDCNNIFTELLYFEGESQENGIELYWSVEFENGPVRYEVQKEVDGNYQTIGAVDSGQEKKVLDRQPNLGKNRYRLKLIGPKNAVAYSEGIDVIFGGENGVYVYPNPTDSDFTLYFSNLQGKAEVTLIDMTGREVDQFEVSGVGETRKSIANRSDLPGGNYLLKIDFNDRSVIDQLIINK